MKIEELKERIGDSAQDIIVSGMTLEKKGTAYECPYRDHKKGKSFAAQWYNQGFHFKCHDCGRLFDISDYAATRGDRMQILHDLANVEFKKFEFKKIEPVTKEKSQSGIEYLVQRGISKETIKEYHITCDEKWICFNYCLPGDGGLVKIKQRIIGECQNGENKYTAPVGGQNILYGMHLLKTQKLLAICEGEIDALSLRECVRMAQKDDCILCSSIPSGSKSFGWIDICRNWLDSFDGIILVPDSDKAGSEFLEKASELLEGYNLSKIELPTNDVNEYLRSADYNPVEIFGLVKAILPEIKGIKNSIKVGKHKKKKSIATGYLTQDYNDSGYRMGCLSLYTGRRGEGKTTYTRQGLISVAKQKEKCFMFCGETTIESEKNKLARLCAENTEISSSQNIGGRIEYYASDKALSNFNELYGEYILLSDCETMKQAFPELKKSSKTLFDNLLLEMKKLARSFGVRIFILDNLMVFCNNMGQGKFSMQEYIAANLKSFVNEFGVHCCLIAHPKSGEGYQKISGAQEIENIADSIFRYVRIDEEIVNKLAKKMPIHTRDRISAMLLTEKVRDDGSSIISFLEWDSKRGAVYDLSLMHQASNYEQAGFWTRQIGQYTQTDQPK